MRDSLAEVLKRFQHDVATHRVEILADNGLHRHLRFRRPGTGIYGFDIVTWPGHLAVSGDMGAAVFSRLADMFEFFRASPEAIAAAPGCLPINTGYWAEKCVANDGAKKKYRSELFRAYVKEHFDEYVAQHHEEGEPAPAWAAALWDELEQMLFTATDCDDLSTAIHAMDDFKPDGESYKDFRFTDAWEAASQLEDYTFHFVWRLFAIAYAVQAYDRCMAGPSAPAGRVLTCVYCGHEYPQGTPAAGAQVLTDHIRVCAKHPLRAAEARTERLRRALSDLIGAASSEELHAMEAAMRVLPAPDADRAVAINAIHALLETQPGVSS